MFGFSVLSSWMRGGDPAANLEVGDLFVRLREKMAQGYFEQLIQQIFLEAPHSCKIVLTPSHAAGETRRKAEAERLSRESAGWSEEDRQALWERQKALEPVAEQCRRAGAAGYLTPFGAVRPVGRARCAAHSNRTGGRCSAAAA